MSLTLEGVEFRKKPKNEKFLPDMDLSKRPEGKKVVTIATKLKVEPLVAK